MKNIIILVGSNSIHTHRYLNAICQDFLSIIFITNNTKGLQQVAKNVETHTINFSLHNIKARFQIANIIGKYHGAIVHIHQANAYAFHTIKAIKHAKLTSKIILTTWGSDILILPTKNIFLKYMVQYNLKNSDIVTSDSLFMSAKIKQLCPDIKELYTINYGILKFPQTLDLNNKKDIILSNRLHNPNYNIDKIIDSYATLIKQNPHLIKFKLVIAGSGINTNKLKQQSQRLGFTHEQIEFTGMLDYVDLLDYYKVAKIFISIPDSDATSLSLLEAMAYGCYPILSNLPANLEWVLDNFNGIINQNVSCLSLDLKRAINYVNDTTKFMQVTDFNHKLIQQKAIYEDNIKKFTDFY